MNNKCKTLCPCLDYSYGEIYLMVCLFDPGSGEADVVVRSSPCFFQEIQQHFYLVTLFLRSTFNTEGDPHLHCTIIWSSPQHLSARVCLCYKKICIRAKVKTWAC